MNIRFAIPLVCAFAVALAGCQKEDASMSTASDESATPQEQATTTPANPAPTATPAPSPLPDGMTREQAIMIQIGAELTSDALTEIFSTRDHPELEIVLEAYATLYENPGKENYAVAAEALETFQNALSGEDRIAAKRPFDPHYGQVIMMYMARTEVEVQKDMVARFAVEFPKDRYPEMAALEQSAKTLAVSTTDPEPQRLHENNYYVFLDSLDPADRERAGDIEAEVRDAWGMR